MRAPSFVWVLALGLASACASSGASRQSTSRTVRPPFTAGEIRGATGVGRTYRFLVETEGAPAVYRRLRFTQVTDVGATYEASVEDAQGSSASRPEEKQETWEGFVKHAAYPAAHTVISDDTVETPAGKFACWLYTVHESADGSEATTRVWFAKELPGAPVKMITEKAGVAVMTMTLVEHRPGT